MGLSARAVFSVLIISVGFSGGAVPAWAGSGTCVPSATTLCLDGTRYQVDVDWTSATGQGQGQVFPFASSSHGLFTLEDPDTVELLVSVVDGCSINGQSWVFLVDLSTNQMAIQAADTLSGAQREYTFPMGATHHPVSDTSALACPALVSASEAGRELGAGGSYLELEDGRFQVTLDWESSSGASGAGVPIYLVGSSGTFWYFQPSSPEFLLKIESNPQTGFYRFVGGPLSTVRHTVSVRDTCRSATRVYDLTEGVSLTVVDEEMHPIECVDHIFANGFESGDLSLWTSASP